MLIDHEEAVWHFEKLCDLARSDVALGLFHPAGRDPRVGIDKQIAGMRDFGEVAFTVGEADTMWNEPRPIDPKQASQQREVLELPSLSITGHRIDREIVHKGGLHERFE